jgi:3-oxoacyl-[acyl-carrier protein] reductase
MKKLCLITGASRGIGAAIARRLARDGLKVLLNYRTNAEAAERVKSEIEAAGGEAELLPFDVASAEEVAQALAPYAQARAQPIQVLVNNAGVVRDALLPTLSREDWELVTRTSLDGFFHVTRPLVMPMVRARWGRIITLSSVSGLLGNKGQVAYSAAKAGLIGATRSLALEVAKRGVTVNAVAPGLIETDMIAGVPPEAVKAIPMQRLGQPDEVAALVGFLAGDQAGYLTGQVIGISGGLG